MYYDINKMKSEKKQQMENRRKIRVILDRIMKYPFELAVLKAASALYLILLQPYVCQMLKDDLEFSQINTVLSIICVIILFIKKKDMEE